MRERIERERLLDEGADDELSPRDRLLRDGFYLPNADEKRWPKHPTREFPLWPENRAAFALFTQRLSTQWQHAGMDGARTGLDMAGVATIMTALGKRLNRYWLDTIQVCETAALAAWSDERKRKARELKQKGGA